MNVNLLGGPLREYVLILRELTENNEVPAELGDESDKQLLSFAESFHIFYYFIEIIRQQVGLKMINTEGFVNYILL